jgi:uncharacterized glyoxalase superfamily protein PhnB
MSTLKTRVTVYLNFPGNAEEAFLFYKKVFKTDFIHGIMRFGDAPPTPGQPPVPDSIINQIMHIELPILGDFLLMGSDAPKELGYDMVVGSNVYINLEPGSMEETKRIYEELSAGGKIEMALQETFWGALYASFIDKYSIRWMVQHPLNG